MSKLDLKERIYLRLGTRVIFAYLNEHQDDIWNVLNIIRSEIDSYYVENPPQDMLRWTNMIEIINLIESEIDKGFQLKNFSVTSTESINAYLCNKNCAKNFTCFYWKNYIEELEITFTIPKSIRRGFRISKIDSNYIRTKDNDYLDFYFYSYHFD